MFSDKNLEFYQVQNYDESLELEDPDGSIVSFFFRFDSNYDSYQRQVYSFWDFLGQVGGLNESLVIIGSVLTVMFTERLFYASVIKRMYHIKNAAAQKNINIAKSNNEVDQSRASQDCYNKHIQKLGNIQTTNENMLNVASIKKESIRDKVRDNINNRTL